MIQIPPELEGEYIIRVMDMPECLNGMVKYDENDFANIYINAHLSPEGRRKAADHELTHVINDDLHNDDPIEVIEARADGLSVPLRSVPRLMRARDLISRSKSLPHQSGFAHASRARDGKVASAQQMTEEVPCPPSPLPQAPQRPITPRQYSVLRNAISDLDAFLFTPSDYDF